MNLSLREAAKHELKTRLILQDPLKLAHHYFEITPNDTQTNFLIDMQNEAMLGHLLQAPRGGGKTIICALSVLWAALKYEKFQALILAGSYEQAATFYSYVRAFIEQCDLLMDKIKGEPLMKMTRFIDGGYIKCLTASERSTRSPHVDWLFIDEFVLVTPDLIDSAFATVRTSTHPKRIFLTTASQTQACVSINRWYDYWDHAATYGFRTYQWGVDQCDWISKQDLELARKMLDPYVFESEYLGLRVGRKGAVWKESQIISAVNTAIEFNRLPEYPTVAGIDWGFSHETVVTIIQPQRLDGVEYSVVLHVEGKAQQDMNVWAYRLEELAQKYKIQAFFCDSSHPFNNQRLSLLDLPIAPIAFSKYKEKMIGEVRRQLEHHLLKLPEHFDKTVRQMKSYSYDPKTEKPIKEDDDYCDSMMLAVWATRQGESFGIGRFL